MTTRTTPQPAERRRLGGLDGLRAIAVALVVVYHLFPEALPGGFLGVDVFFVISGFLITTLLLEERRRTGRIALLPFWQRRARRLLPALGLVLLVCTSAALVLGGDLLVSIGAQLAGAALFVANWVYIGLGADYFARDNPELFRNTWSLAIEEQFYLLLPLALLFALRMRSRASRTLFFATLGAASAIWMAALHAQGAPVTRIYFGTDSHLFGLLLGVSLACALRLRDEDRASLDTPRPSAPRQLALLLIGASGLAVLGWLSLHLREGGPESFAWGFQLATAAMLATVWAATREGAWLGRALDVQPLRWVGERSYGIYLWHWPLLLIVAEAVGRSRLPAAAAPWVVALLTATLALALAALSYRFVEQPVRRWGLRRSLARLWRPLRLRGAQRFAGIAVLAVILVALPATGIAVATAPVQSSSAGVIARGQAVLDAQGRPGRPADVPSASGSTPAPARVPVDGEQPSTADELEPGAFTGDWEQQPEFEVPLPPPVEGWQIFAVGDSVMLASAPELAEAFPSIWIDAAVSRGLGAGVEIVDELAVKGQLREVLVVGLGTNGPIDRAELDALRRVADGRGIVLVNAYADRWWIAEVNQQLSDFAERHRGVVLADWAGAIAEVPGGLAGDDIHPNPSGGVAYAEAVQRALDALVERDEQPKPGSSRSR